jgi:hypothetical protein
LCWNYILNLIQAVLRQQLRNTRFYRQSTFLYHRAEPFEKSPFEAENGELELFWDASPTEAIICEDASLESANDHRREVLSAFEAGRVCLLGVQSALA